MKKMKLDRSTLSLQTKENVIIGSERESYGRRTYVAVVGNKRSNVEQMASRIGKTYDRPNTPYEFKLHVGKSEGNGKFKAESVSIEFTGKHNMYRPDQTKAAELFVEKSKTLYGIEMSWADV